MYGKNQDNSEMDADPVKSNPEDEASQMQIKTPSKKLITLISSGVPGTEGPECIEKRNSVPVKFKCGAPQRPLDRDMSPSGSLGSVQHVRDVTDFGSTVKANKILKSNKMESADYPPNTRKASAVFRPPTELGKDIPRKITIKQPKGLVDQQRHVELRSDQETTRKTRKNVELSSSENKIREDDYWCAGEPGQTNLLHERRLSLDVKGSKGIMGNDESWITSRGKRHIHDQILSEYETREEGFRKEKKKDKKSEVRDERRVPERPLTKRRRGGEVELSNILEKIVDHMRKSTAISYLFLKPVTKKDAPDYLDIVKRPMDLGTIKDKVRKMEYKSREGFRQDVAQIAVNAHIYNDSRHSAIPPLADDLLKMCDHLLEESAGLLDDAEGAIKD